MKKYNMEHTTDCCRQCHFCKLEPKNRVANETWLMCYHDKINGRKITTEYIEKDSIAMPIPIWRPLEDVENK